MPLRITHCRALALKVVHRRRPAPPPRPRAAASRARAAPPAARLPPREGSPRAQGPHSHFADGSSPVDAQVIELTMAKTFVASMARGLGALLLITLALETQANRARPAFATPSGLPRSS